MAAERERKLIFEGLRFPRAKITETVIGLIIEEDGTERRLDNRPPVFAVRSQPDGKPWRTNEQQGFWVDFAEIDLADGEQVVAFVRRRGLCFNDDPAKREEHTDRWPDLQAWFRILLRAWDPPDDDGTRRITDIRKDVGKWVIAARNYDRDLTATRLLRDLEVVPDPAGNPGATAYKARILASYMVASAMHGLERRLPLRPCDWCGSHYYRLRADARFCSASCRAREHERAKQVTAA
jgi:hypothetical protein